MFPKIFSLCFSVPQFKSATFLVPQNPWQNPMTTQRSYRLTSLFTWLTWLMSGDVYKLTERTAAHFCDRLHLHTVIAVNFKAIYWEKKVMTRDIIAAYMFQSTSVVQFDDIFCNVSIDLIPGQLSPSHQDARSTFRRRADIWRCFPRH